MEANAAKPAREQLTLIRIFEELRGCGYGGGYDAVRRYARRWAKERGESTAAAYVPLSFAPGEAFQFDWSHEVVVLNGVTVTVKVAHVRLCHSRMPLVRAYPRETQEMVFDAHDRAFAFFRGACRRGIYDNMKTAVETVFVGKDRLYNRRFLQMCSHYLVDPVACTPASGWEKGQVENQVGLVRERFFTPRLRFKTYDELNAWLLDQCIAYAKAHRHPELTDQTIWEAFEAERPKLVPYTGLQCCHKVDDVQQQQHRLSFAKSNQDLIAALGNTVNVGGGTAWLWSRADAFDAVDVLFVDEAAQMSLANVLAVSQAAKTVVLIGDPQQLDQPSQGSHPDGTDVSALDHILAGEHTIPADRGLFLEETWRLHPDICAFTSELFYDGKLSSRSGLEIQTIKSAGPISGAGLRYLPVQHEGNQNCSPEEAEAVATLITGVLEDKTTWVDRDGQEKPVTIDDILIIAPYNAQVFEIQRLLPGARVGTVD